VTVKFNQHRPLRVGDPVIVRATGGRALVTAERPEDHYQVEFLPDPKADPIDRDSPEWEDESGIYLADELEPVDAGA
jgi:hypothetical protein